MTTEKVIVEAVSFESKLVTDFRKEIYDLDCQLDLLTSHADILDYVVATGSGIISGLMDILWVGEFSLSEGREISSTKIEEFVKTVAQKKGCKKDDLTSCVKYLEDMFPIAADGNTPDFGGGLQHHLRDFAHHPTIVGLIFSLVTQFTGKSYGTDTAGRFIVVDVPEASKIFIGKDTQSKIFNGTVIWFFHLVSDVAGSSSTAGKTGGTGLPGPILSLAKEISALPIFNIKTTDEDKNPFSVLLSKLFNGTLLSQRDEKGKIIPESIQKLDLRGEMGVLEQFGKQALPVIANECIVRAFYFIRQLAITIKKTDATTVSELKDLPWKEILPVNSPTLTRMLTVATGVFTTLDIADAVISQKYWVSVNYVGVARFSLAVNGEIAWGLKRQDIKAIKAVYEKLDQYTFQRKDKRLYERIQKDMMNDKLGLNLDEIEILYNIEYYKTKNDIDQTNIPVGQEMTKALKSQWLKEWSEYMVNGYDEFVQIKEAELHWYPMDELKERISKMNPDKTWFKLVMLEAMLFEPYFALSTEQDKKGKEIPSKKYNSLNVPLVGFITNRGDDYLEQEFSKAYCPEGFISRLRKSYNKAVRELNEVTKAAIKGISIGAGVLIVAIFTAGALAPTIAVALVGSNFAGLSGVALTNACLAYLGGGAIAAGGAGMAGGTIAVVGGGAILGIGAGAGAGGITAAVSLGGKRATILQSAKLMVSIREIFLNEENDTEYSTTVYEQYIQNISEIEKNLVDLRLKADVASKEEKKELAEKIKNTEESVAAMKIAMKSMNKFISAYKVGLGEEE